MVLFKKILGKLSWFFSELIPSCGFVLLFITFMITIVSRYVFNTPVPWTYEVSVLAYMWIMFFAVGLAFKNKDHVVFSLLYDTLSDRGKFLTQILSDALIALLLILSFVPCFDSWISKEMITGVLKIPYPIAFAPFMWMYAELIVRSIISIVSNIKVYKTTGKVS